MEILTIKMEQLITEVSIIESYLEIECSTEPNEIQERICKLMVYLFRTGNMLAEAKKILRMRKSAEINKTIIAIAKEACLSAKVQNTLIDSIASEECFLVDKLDRMNAGIVHQIDALRSLLSYTKEELRLTKTGY